MDKYEYNLKIDQIKSLCAEGNYDAAADICDAINWSKVRNVNALVKAGEVYEKQGRYEESKEILLAAYDRSPIGRMIIYRLAEVAIKMHDIESARAYYHEFVEIAPHDNLKYVLRYKICQERGGDYKEQIEILEALKEQEYTEEWAFELAYVYHQAGDASHCVEACDELILWFGDGPYVERALELKMLYQPLTKAQEEKYRRFNLQNKGYTSFGAEEMKKAGEFVHEPVDIPQVSISPERFNTVNLQEEIAKGMQQIMEATEKETVSDTIDNIKKIVGDNIPYLQLQDNIDTTEEGIHIATDEEIDGSLKINFKEMLGEDSDGQMSLVMKEKAQLEQQITGQMTISEVLDEWEKTKHAAEVALQEAEAQKLESAKQRALLEAGDIMDRLNDVIPKLDAGLSPKELLVEEYMQDMSTTESVENTMDMSNNPVEESISQGFDDSNKSMVSDFRQLSAGLDLVEGAGEMAAALASEEAVQGLVAGELESEVTAGIAGFVAEGADAITSSIADLAATGIEGMLEVTNNDGFSTEGLVDSDSETDSEITDNQDTSYENIITEGAEDNSLNISGDIHQNELVSNQNESTEVTSIENEITNISNEVPENELENNSVESPENELIDNPEENSETISTQTTENEPDNAVPADTASMPSAKEIQQRLFEQMMTARITDDTSAKWKGKTQRMPKLDMPEIESFNKDDVMPEPVKEIERLTDEQRAVFSYFVPIKGMEEQLCSTLNNVTKHLVGDRFASTGNVIIQGGAGCGKTALATSLIKVLQKQSNRLSGKVGKIDAAVLNKKNIGELLNKVAGGCLIIEKAGELSRESVVTLSLLLANDTSGILIILEDTSKGIKKLMMLDSGFAKKFTETINVPIFTIDELVAFARSYAKELGYEIEEIAVLALYNRIGKIERLDQATTLVEVKEIVDEAITRESKGRFKKAISILTSSRYNDDGYIILKEKDFE